MKFLVLFLFIISLIVMLPIVSLSAQKSLVLYLPFDGNLNDLSNTGLKGKLEGKADFIDGKARKALLFDGKSSVEIPNDKALNLTRAHAISSGVNGMVEVLVGARFVS